MEEERYLLAQLSQAEDRVAVKALQWLCERCREGFWFAETTKIRASIRLCLHRSHPNAKRWAVNALTEIGPGKDVSPILGLVALTDDDPDLLAAIVAAIFSSKSEEEAVDLLAAHNVGMEGLVLIAASQHSVVQKAELVRTMVPLETSDAANLRAAIVMAGLRKAPEHLFDRRHPNAIALSQLNKHDVASVSKYSIWGISQLKLGFSSLLLPESDIESSPPEVRKWVYRLLISDPPAMAKRLDMLGSIQRDPSPEVREESAIELRDNFAPGLERYVSDWFFKEEHRQARLLLLDHMAAQSTFAERYEEIVVEFYKRASPKSDERIRLEAAAAGTQLYAKLRKIDIEEEKGVLFAMNDNDSEKKTAGDVYNVTQHIQANQIGAVSGGPITGETIAAVAHVENGDTKDILTAVLAIIEKIEDAAVRKEAEKAVKEVAESPSPSKWRKVLGLLKGVQTGAIAVGGAVTGIDKLIELVGPLVT